MRFLRFWRKREEDNRDADLETLRNLLETTRTELPADAMLAKMMEIGDRELWGSKYGRPPAPAAEPEPPPAFEPAVFVAPAAEPAVVEAPVSSDDADEVVEIEPAGAAVDDTEEDGLSSLSTEELVDLLTGSDDDESRADPEAEDEVA